MDSEEYLDLNASSQENEKMEESKDSIKFMLLTDHRLGLHEKNNELRDDCYTAFEESLQI